MRRWWFGDRLQLLSSHHLDPRPTSPTDVELFVAEPLERSPVGEFGAVVRVPQDPSLVRRSSAISNPVGVRYTWPSPRRAKSAATILIPPMTANLTSSARKARDRSRLTGRSNFPVKPETIAASPLGMMRVAVPP